MSIKVTWYGHASLGLETSGFKILVDPYFTGNPAVTVTADEVTADFILITHGHGDHVGDAVSIAKRTGAMVISNFEIAGWMEQTGCTKDSWTAYWWRPRASIWVPQADTCFAWLGASGWEQWRQPGGFPAYHERWYETLSGW